MSAHNRFSDEFKKDAISQVVDRGYPVAEVADRLGVSTKSIYTRKAQFSKPARCGSVRTSRQRRSGG